MRRRSPNRLEHFLPGNSVVLAIKCYAVHGELDTRVGQASSLSAQIRHFYPSLSATLGVGLRYDKHEKLRYTVRAKKTFPVTVDKLFDFKIKGRCDVDQNFKEKDQDVRLRLGYEVFEQVPYVQLRENNWTFNADYKGRWSVRFDL
ncbi:Outer envelope pore protein [Arachis hypogaea]|nr:Outer envelope pore protein [Arachis hypogaea]